MPELCPACGSHNSSLFYSLERVPVHSVRLLWSRKDALSFPTGTIDLAFCKTCGFVWNQSYQPELQDYSAEYESTQAYSSTFNSFAQRLAEQLIQKYNLHGKDIIEIGCGQGEFLYRICDMGNNRGVGFDPAYDPDRTVTDSRDRVIIIADYYSEKYAGHKADFVVCKMTLEHIQDVASFVRTVRSSIGDRLSTTVFFQVPDVLRILDEVAFWDIYYEHCSYFSLGSIARLFRQEGFDVIDLWRDYGDQYLMIEARPAGEEPVPPLPQEDDLGALAEKVALFQTQAVEAANLWENIAKEAYQEGKKTVLWGSGSKGVAFLTTLQLCDQIEKTVDINPKKHGTFMAGTGQAVISPDDLVEYRPDLVIVMNPLYRDEVRENLKELGLNPTVLSVGE